MRHSLAADGGDFPILAYPVPDLSERPMRTQRGGKKGPISIGFATGRPERENLRALAQPYRRATA